MKKTFIALSCLAAVAIAAIGGMKSSVSNAFESNGLLQENVEALSASSALPIHYRCKNTTGTCYVINLLIVIDGELTKEELPTE